jgi:hypothetical protein
MTGGYRGAGDWRDMSDFLVHLVASATELRQLLDNKSIPPFSERALGAIGNHSAVDSHFPSQRSACLSEIPMDFLDRLVKRHGEYGIILHRDAVIEAGGVRVWYLEENTPVATFLKQEVGTRAFHNWSEIEHDDPLWKLTPFIDFQQLGDAGKTRYQFDWEREWRVLDGFDIEGTVAGLAAPESRHTALAAYGFPLLDLTWSSDRLEGAVADMRDPNA